MRGWPAEIRGFSPPFLGALQEPGLIQMWTGWSRARRRLESAGASLRHLPRSQPIELFEGIIETDRWFGPLITNFRVTQTNVPVDFRADFPILQVPAAAARGARRGRPERLRVGR